jgi:glycosyltransferase involved in cell wall biosynthesis
MTLAAIIPTKNRPEDLLEAVKSIVNQLRLPDQLIIIDQSETSASFDLITSKIAFPEKIKLEYVRDTSIKGLVEAKAASLNFVKTDIVCFFEDDIVLESDYVLQIERVFLENQKMLGCSGIITNATSGNNFYRFFYRITHVGIFKDLRPDIYAELESHPNAIVQSNVINGGLSAWRFSLFKQVSFDVKNRFHMMEDYEFSTRVDRMFPGSLFICSAARLEHNYSPVNRAGKLRGIEMKTYEYFLFYKKNRTVKNSTFDFLKLIMGLLLSVALDSLKSLSIKPILAFVRGYKSGAKYQLK